MKIDDYLEIIKIKEVYNKICYQDAIRLLKNNLDIDCISYNITRSFNRNILYQDSIVFELNEPNDFIKNIKCNIPLFLLIEDREIPIIPTTQSPLILMPKFTAKIKLYLLDMVNDHIITMQYQAYTFSNIIKHEFNYYKKHDLIDWNLEVNENL